MSAPADPSPEPIVSEPGEALPYPLTPPQTKAPVQFNQQVNNYYSIPQTVWDRLSPEQIVDLSKAIIAHAVDADRRSFEFAMNEARSERQGKKLAMIVGGLVTVLGIGGAIYLGMNNHPIIALSVALPLATIVAMLVGNRFIG